ncbi:MAG: Fic family protein [Deltaproteobacteria bacterium]|nr:Fic family protein [Deltaproteobacteria bacterium]
MKRLSLQKDTKYIWRRHGWPNLTYDNNKLSVLLGKVRFSQGLLLGRMGELGFNLSEEARGEILVNEAVKTSAVEGTILNYDSVRSSVARRLGLPSADLPSADRYVDGIIEVLLDATNNYNSSLTVQRLLGWQAALFPTGFSGLHRINVGKWRGSEPMRVVSGPIGHETIHFEAPPYKKIDHEIKKFLAWWSKSYGGVDGLIRAGIAHLYFVTIHPFEDGNGRIARALTDMALAQDEKMGKRFYSLSTQIMAERNKYYDILESSQKGDLDITDWLVWFLQCTERAITNAEKIVSKVLAKASFWKKNSATTINERQRKVINLLLDTGPGGFMGGLTTRKYVSFAKTSRVTAYREITDLLEKGLIKQNDGKGRNVSYDVNW